MMPVKRFLLAYPGSGWSLRRRWSGYSFGGWRLGLLAACCWPLFIAVDAGKWAKAMITIYLCGCLGG